MANASRADVAETSGLRPHFGSPLVSRDKKLQCRSQRGLVGLRLYMCANTTCYTVQINSKPVT